MNFEYFYFLTIFVFFNSLHLSLHEHRCYPCNETHPFAGYRQCGEEKRKSVDFSGLCSRCSDPVKNCTHQVGESGSKCQFNIAIGEDSKGRIYDNTRVEGCPAADVRDWPGSILQCDGPSGMCQCPPPSTGPVPLEDEVVITAFGFECDCAPDNQWVTTPDIRISNTGLRDLALVSSWQGGEGRSWWCGQFHLSGARPGPHQLRYDCPNYLQTQEGLPVRLQICTARHTVQYIFNMPALLRDGVKRTVENWEPLVAAHRHRSDHLVFSVQRSPPDLGIAAYDVKLVRCRNASNCSAGYTVVEGSEKHVKAEPSKDERQAGVFRVQFDIPEEAGNLSLVVRPEGGRETFSAVISHPGKNTAQLAIFASLLALILVVAIAAIVWFKKFYKPSPPAVMDVLVLYNRNAGLARHVARQLDSHCLVRTRLDVVDIPRAGGDMDPVDWLTRELERCTTVLLLVFPEDTAPSIYESLYRVALHRLQLDAGKRTVVIGYAGVSCCPSLPALPAARRCRLPSQLTLLARAVRGAGWWIGRGSQDARELARRLTASEGGRELVKMLERPSEIPPEADPLPVSDREPPSQPQPLLPPPPPANGHLLAPHIASFDDVLAGRPAEVNGTLPVEGADDDDWGV